MHSYSLTWPGFKVYVKSYIKKVNCYEIYQKIRCKYDIIVASNMKLQKYWMLTSIMTSAYFSSVLQINKVNFIQSIL